MLAISNRNSFRVLLDKTVSVIFMWKNILALEMASPGNQTFPLESGTRYEQSWDGSTHAGRALARWRVIGVVQWHVNKGRQTTSKLDDRHRPDDRRHSRWHHRNPARTRLPRHCKRLAEKLREGCGILFPLPLPPLLSLIHIWRCRRSTLCRSRWSPYH